jgi:hypothetical protein
MKLARFYCKADEARTPHCGVVADADGTLALLAGVSSLLDVRDTEDSGAAAVAQAVASGKRFSAGDVQLLPPVAERECHAVFCMA